MLVTRSNRRQGVPDHRSHAALAGPRRGRVRPVGLVIVLALLAALFVAGCGSSTSTDSSASSSSSASPATSTSPTATSSSSPELVFKDPEFAFELRRTMSLILSGDADVGECLATAGRITDGNFESWYTQWNATAKHFKRVARRAQARGRLVTARDAYYRVATYFRTAEFFLHGNPKDPRIVSTWRKGRNAFVTAANLDDRVNFESVWIPYDKTKLPGYFYSAKSGSTDGAEKRPLLIVQTGFDGCQEELHPYAIAAVERGYNVLTFEGPGQGQVIRVQHLPFRPDWEHVVRQVVDYVVTRDDVDRDRMALWGISLGGYLAPRAAAYDHRLAACVADAGIYSVGELLLDGLKEGKDVPSSMTVEKLHEWLLGNPSEFNQAIYSSMRDSTTMRWQNQQGMFVFRQPTPALMWAQYMQFSLAGVVQKIKCPTLVTWGTTDSTDPGGAQARQLYDKLTCEKRIMKFTAEYEAGYHCQFGAFALSFGQKFDWLDAQMQPER